MAVHLKSEREIKGIRAAGRVVAGALAAAGKAVGPGKSLQQLEQVCDDFIRSHGGYPTFLGYRGFPAAVCIGVNEEVVHGIPGRRRLTDGDIVKIDVGVTKDGLIADGARTFPVGNVKPAVLSLVAATERAFWLGAAQAKAGNRVSDIGHAVQAYIEAQGYSVVRDLCGHGVGTSLHEDPSVPNFGKPGQGMRLVAGMTLAIEPMVNMGRFEVETLENGWTVVAADRRPSAHYEHTLLVTSDEPEILTADN
ncbi:type I methionyl aminopeptidase [candidate division WOR-3 bacterium]|nr:type I methionyl aminopeptidase [candidate division WOR-3 bacterium]